MFTDSSWKGQESTVVKYETEDEGLIENIHMECVRPYTVTTTSLPGDHFPLYNNPAFAKLKKKLNSGDFFFP